jgi:hypothetical protein
MLNKTTKGLGNVLLTGAPVPANENGWMYGRERLGSFLNYYPRVSA